MIGRWSVARLATGIAWGSDIVRTHSATTAVEPTVPQPAQTASNVTYDPLCPRAAGLATRERQHRGRNDKRQLSHIRSPPRMVGP
jgi:hypothetical protein